MHRRAKSPLSIAVAPVGKNTASASGGPVAALLIVDPDRRTTTSAAHLRDLYSLTPAECRTALALLDGASLQDVAAHFAVSVNAVRVHLRHLFEKTGTHRQSELVRLLLAHRLPRTICRLLVVVLPCLVDGLDALPGLA
ncbi:MAG: helix-turn-helix transcriptional regulator [Geminicoccaceae bacterium]